MDTFDKIPDYNVQVDHNLEDAVREVKFGNGVVQLQRKTLSRPLRKFSMTFTRRSTDLDEIESFLISQTGKRFNWTGYGNQAITVRCTKISRKTTGIMDELSCEFDEDLYAR